MTPFLSHRQIVLLQPAALSALIAGILLGRFGAAGWIIPLIFLTVSVTVAVLNHSWLRFSCIGLCFFFLGSVLGYCAYHPDLPEEATYEITGIVADELRDGNKTQHRTSLRDVTLNGEPFSAGAYWSFYTDEVPEGLVPGATVSFTARVYAPSGAENEGGFDFREYLLQQGITIGIYGMDDLVISHDRFSLWGFAASLRHILSQQLVTVMGQDAGAYASAMLLGTRSLLSDEDRTAFNRLGISHLLSVSGYHVGVLCLLAGFLLKKLSVRKHIRFVITAIVLACYCLLTGMHAPVVRATLLVLLLQYGELRWRQRTTVLLLCTSAIIQLIFSPQQLTSVSFQLTYGALAGLTLLTPQMKKLLSPKHKAAQTLWAALCSSVCAQIGILLPELYWYQEFPVLGIAVNVVVLSFSQIILGLYWVIFFLQWIPAIGPAVGQAGAWITSLLTGAAKAASSADWLMLWTPQANWLTALGCIGLLVLGTWLLTIPKKARRLGVLTCLAVTALSLIPISHTGTDYIQLSVGNADAAVLLDEETVCVIDTGESGGTLSNWLHQRRLSVDTLILTHLHSDHAGGVEDLLDDGIPIAVCYISTEAEAAETDEGMTALLERLSQSGTELRKISRGDTLSLPNGTITVLWPEEGKTRPGKEANESSMALLAQLRGTSMLLAGDLDGTYEMYAAVSADILKAAHHGSSGSTSEEFLQAVSPSVILQSCGDDKREASLRQRAGSVPVYSTNSAGQITIHIGEDHYSVGTFR